MSTLVDMRDVYYKIWDKKRKERIRVKRGYPMCVFMLDVCVSFVCPSFPELY